MTVREELYRSIKARLESICINGADGLFIAPDDADSDILETAIKHIDLWNRNVEFIEQEAAWQRPAVFVEFAPIRWEAIVTGVEYRADVAVNLHVVTDWDGGEGIGEFRLPDIIHEALAGLEGKTFAEFDIRSSTTNHDHEEIVENIESYGCVGFRHLQL